MDVNYILAPAKLHEPQTVVLDIHQDRTAVYKRATSLLCTIHTADRHNAFCPMLITLFCEAANNIIHQC